MGGNVMMKGLVLFGQFEAWFWALSMAFVGAAAVELWLRRRSLAAPSAADIVDAVWPEPGNGEADEVQGSDMNMAAKRLRRLQGVYARIAQAFVAQWMRRGREAAVARAKVQALEEAVAFRPSWLLSACAAVMALVGLVAVLAELSVTLAALSMAGAGASAFGGLLGSIARALPHLARYVLLAVAATVVNEYALRVREDFDDGVERLLAGCEGALKAAPKSGVAGGEWP